MYYKQTYSSKVSSIFVSRDSPHYNNQKYYHIFHIFLTGENKSMDIMWSHNEWLFYFQTKSTSKVTKQLRNNQTTIDYRFPDYKAK